MIDLNVLKENLELAKSVKLEITGADLLVFGESIHKSAIADAEKIIPQKPEKYLTPQEFADTIQVSLVTLWHWDKTGITKPVRIGNAKRYLLSDLEKILQDRR